MSFGPGKTLVVLIVVLWMAPSLSRLTTASAFQSQSPRCLKTVTGLRLKATASNTAINFPQQSNDHVTLRTGEVATFGYPKTRQFTLVDKILVPILSGFLACLRNSLCGNFQNLKPVLVPLLLFEWLGYWAVMKIVSRELLFRPRLYSSKDIAFDNSWYVIAGCISLTVTCCAYSSLFYILIRSNIFISWYTS